jgi:hypothetical protein
MAADAIAATNRLRRARDLLTSVGPVVLAFLAGQHHTLHMLLLTFGAGTAGMSFLTMYPAIRRAMLAASLGVTGLAAYRATRPGQPRSVRLMHAFSVALTLVLVGWSASEFGI